MIAGTELETLAASIKEKPTPPLAIDVVKLDLIEVSRLTVDGRYQRKISQTSASRLRKIIREFDWNRFGAIIVAAQGETFSVIDGQHRAVAAQILAIDLVPAVVIEADLKNQARDFVGINCNRTSVATIDKFRARVTSGDPIACSVSEILKELDISTDVPAGSALKERQTRAVSLLEKLTRSIGKGEVFTALELLLDAQPDVPDLLTSFAIESTAMALHVVLANQGDIERLLKIIEDTDFDDLKDRAQTIVRSSGGGKQAIEGKRLLLNAYNKGLHKRIS